MNYPFSERIKAMQPSAIREILKATADPAIIPLAAGNPAPDAFPVDEVRRITADILRESPVEALQYSVTEGHPPLRAALRELLALRYCALGAEDDVLVTTGAQQCMDLIARCFLNEGAAVICENPSFIGSLNCFRSYRARLIGVGMEEDGIRVEALEQALQSNPDARLIYLIPNFQNPSGITMSAEKRRAVYALAQRYDAIIVEDNPYGDLRYHGSDVPPIKSLDVDGRVIYCGSFSKILSPGIRVGFLSANKAVLPKLTVAKQCADVHTAILMQMLCHRFLLECDLTAHIARLRASYSARLALMLSGIDTQWSSAVRHTSPEGGLFVWCTLPAGADAMDFCARALKRSVAVVPGSAFMCNEGDETTAVRLNFTTPSVPKIKEGVELLGALTKELYGA